MSNRKDTNWEQPIVDNLNWNVLREYYEDKKDTEEFKSMSQSEIEQWFLKEVNTPLTEQGLTLKTIDEVRELLNRPYSTRKYSVL